VTADQETPTASKNERAEQLMGLRYPPGTTPGLIVNHPCEEGYRCPVCKIDWDEDLWWSEYRAFLWCPRCNIDYPSVLCIPLDAQPDPDRPWRNAGPAMATDVYLNTVRDAVARHIVLANHGHETKANDGT
jgi:hypothetical protein